MMNYPIVSPIHGKVRHESYAEALAELQQSNNAPIIFEHDNPYDLTILEQLGEDFYKDMHHDFIMGFVMAGIILTIIVCVAVFGG